MTNQSPQTHVLIIGVGGYRFLPGGESFDVRRFYMNLQQLTSPPISAQAFYEWMTQNLRTSEAPRPLGSVQLLLSPASPNAQLPTLQNVKLAYDKWSNDCDSNDANVAIFYFCGHGLMIQGDHILLLEDFGERPSAKLENAINFERMYKAMACCSARYQFYFIDACSQIDLNNQDLDPREASSLGSVRDSLSGDGLAIIATSPGESATGAVEQVSTYTETLLKGLQALAYEEPDIEQDPDLWQLTDTQLLHTLCSTRPQGYTHRTILGSTKRIVLRQTRIPPRVSTTIYLNPNGSMEQAQILTLQAMSGNFERELAQTQAGEWPSKWVLDEVPSGRHYFDVKFPATSRYQDLAREKLWISPLSPRPQPPVYVSLKTRS